MHQFIKFLIIASFLFIANAHAFSNNNFSSKEQKYHDKYGYTYKKSSNPKIITRNDGTTYYISGLTITSSDGTEGELIGNTIRLNNNKTCYINNRYLDCE